MHLSNDEGDGVDSEGEPEPTPKNQKNYDRSRKFQLEWAANMSWAEGIMSADGTPHCLVPHVFRGGWTRPPLCPEMGHIL
jgi:hypothetical protein